MTLAEKLNDVAAAVSTAATHAPDAYPDWGFVTYDGNMADIRELWSEIQPKTKKDINKATFVDGKLQDAYRAFHVGDKETGQNALWEIYNSGIKNLR